MRKSLLLVTLLGAGITAQAQDSLRTTHLDELVVTGSRKAISKEKSGKMIFQITDEDIQKSGVRSLPDLLNQVPGVQIDGNFGSLGTNIGYFVRGAASKRTLILIDGVSFNDPSSIDLNYDLRLVDINTVQSIEILRGGLSSLYGSGAAAAVISIKTKSPKEEQLDGSVSIEAGSFGLVRGSVNARGTSKKISYGFSGGYMNTEGFSAAKENSSAVFDKDGMTQENASIRIGFQVTDGLKVETLVNLDQFENEFDTNAFTDDSVGESTYLQKRIGAKTEYSYEEGQISAHFFKNILERRFVYGGFPNDYKAANNQANIQVSHAITDIFSFIAGMDLQSLEYSQPFQDQTDFQSQAPYMSAMVEGQNFNLQIGGRLNNHSDYGTQFVYNLNPSYTFDLGSTTLKTLFNYSTSYITPSLYQLNGPFANPDLTPELSQGWDLGGSIYDNGLEMNAVYFQREDNDFIDFESFYDNELHFVGRYFNSTGQSLVEGVEIDAKLAVDKIKLNAQYAWLNNLKGDLRQRIPRIKYGLGLGYSYHENGLVRMNFTWTGKRVQTNPEDSSRVRTGSFGLVDLSANQRIGRFTMKGSINNLLNKEYEAILGYTTIGRNFLLGVAMDLGK